jgi:hypothetical protein
MHQENDISLNFLLMLLIPLNMVFKAFKVIKRH